MFFLLGIFWAKHAVYLNQNNLKFHPMFPILHRRTSDSEVTFHMFYSKCAWVDAWQPPVCLVIQLGNNLACVLGGNWPSVNINRNPETNCSKEWTTHWNKGSFKGKRYFISSEAEFGTKQDYLDLHCECESPFGWSIAKD